MYANFYQFAFSQKKENMYSIVVEMDHEHFNMVSQNESPKIWFMIIKITQIGWIFTELYTKVK